MDIIKTIDYVNPSARDWTADDGKTMYFVGCIFDDGSEGSVVCFSQQQIEQNMEALKALVGKETTFGVKDKVREYNGTKQYSITSYPGKPAGSGGSGGKGGGGMSHPQVGLLAAATVLAPRLAQKADDDQYTMAVVFNDVVELGEMFTEHLFTRRAAEQSGSGEESGSAADDQAAPAAPAPADAITLQQMKRIKELGQSKGLDSPEKIAEFLSIGKLGDMTKDDAETLIESWSA